MDSLYTVVDNVAIPEWLVDAAMCEPNKGSIDTPEIWSFVEEQLLPLVMRQTQAQPTLYVSSNHVHISAAGLTPHDHLPNVFTSVLYLVDAEGRLIIDPDGINERVKPVAGRFVIFKGETIHAVEKSPQNELRISLVSNYEYPSV